MENKIKVAHIISEVDPFAKTGGLGTVGRSLPKALARLGNQVVVIMPFYEQIIDVEKHHIKLFKNNITIKVDDSYSAKIDIFRGWLLPNLPVYFIANKKYFSKKKTVYGSQHENARFYLFNLAALKTLKILDFQPEVIHCHDWHSGLIPELLNKRFKKDLFFKKTATLYTIHNLMFQMGKSWADVPTKNRDNGASSLPTFKNPEIENVNFAKRAIINANIINAVSESYALEILTKDFGEDLHRLLKNRKDKLFGIVNGIDYDDYNPEKDPGIYKKYNSNSINGKKANKKWLQKYTGLEINPDIPVITMLARIAEQKGFDLLKKIIEPLMNLDLQFAIMGDGQKDLITFFKKIEKRFPHKFRLVPFEQKYETSFYAGADMLLLPSKFEPCGLNQLISLRYGCVPIVRKIGGLSDTVDDFDARKKIGNGFVFEHYYSKELLIAIVRALETYKYSKVWREIVVTGMKTSNSWVIPAQKYEVLYHKAIIEKQNNV